MITYTREILEQIEKKQKKNSYYCRLIIIMIIIISLFAVFFVERCRQWYDGSHITYERIFNGGDESNPFISTRIKEVDVYSKTTLKFIGEAIIIIDY